MDSSRQHTHVKKGAQRANEVLSKSLTYDLEGSDGDKWWF